MVCFEFTVKTQKKRTEASYNSEQFRLFKIKFDWIVQRKVVNRNG